MKRKLVTLFLMISMLGVLAWTPSAACFGCGAVEKQQCEQEALTAMDNCWRLYGPILGYPQCTNEYWETRDTCLMVKGCPIPPRNP